MLAFSSSLHIIIPQHRLKNETFEQSLTRIKKIVPQNFLMRESPITKKIAIKDISFSLAPKVSSKEELLSMFHAIRDNRFMFQEAMPDFGRRISWLYPDDGCFSRAGMTGIELEKEHFIRPAKIFVFGDLEVETPYTKDRTVSWWYHVAGVVDYMGTIYVLDPALNSDAPMLVDEWFNKMGASEAMLGVVCNTYTYDPFDYCFKATSKSDNFARRDQSEYLNKEWTRIESLGFDPASLLGDTPPWSE